MKPAAILLAGLAVVAATPVITLEQRQKGGDATSNDIKNGVCKPITLVMARGSTEKGNMGPIAGAPLCAGLKQQMGADQVACQGVGAEDGYAAALPPNFQPKNTDDQSIAAGMKIINMAATSCPSTTMLVGGYSQGSAVMDNAIQGLPADTVSRISGVVLFGFTRNTQDNGQIPGYPQAQTKVFCAKGDMVCDNTLTISAAHLSYGSDAGAAASFLAGMVPAAGKTAATAAGTGGKKKKNKNKNARDVSAATAQMAAEFASAQAEAHAANMI